MSTNYYARLDREATDMTIHLGLLGSGVVALSGVLFDSWADMKRFLVRNESFGLWVVDEAGGARLRARLHRAGGELHRGGARRAVPRCTF